VKHRGYYPQGGGTVLVTVKKKSIERIVPGETGNGSGIRSCSSNLPAHVAVRQGESAARVLAASGSGHFPVSVDRREGPGTGSSVTAWCGWKGGSAIGRRGWPAEEVGKAAAEMLAGELGQQGTVDTHLADQLLIYLAQYGGEYSTGGCTLHAETMCRLLAEFGYPVAVSKDGTAVFSS
jgi:RNA 3'-terminal phosphate cyclase (ATP)